MVSNGCSIGDAAQARSSVHPLAWTKDTVNITTVTYSGDFDLDGGMILGSNEPVGGGAFPGNVELHNALFIVLHL